MIQLAPWFWSLVNHWNDQRNFYRQRVETGGFLAARPDTPDVVAFATGPGRDATHAKAEMEMCRYDVEPAVEEAGYKVIGDWHTHPVGVRPSDTDQETWEWQLKNSTLRNWHSIILARDENEWSQMSAWSTSWRDGAYRTDAAEVTPGLSTSSELVRDFSWFVKRTSLVDQDVWLKDPPRLHLDLAVLEQNEDLRQRVKLEETNARLRRLGMPEMKPLPLPRREAVDPREIPCDGQMIRRYFPNAVIRVR